jgi:hypothetical protein
MIKNLHYLIVLTVLLGACEKVEKIEDFPLVPPKLVVNATFNETLILTFEISKSLSVIDNAEIRHVRNATIDIFENNIFVESLDQSNIIDERYISTKSYGKKDVIYRIEVSAPKFASVTATTSLPSNADFSNLEIQFIDSSWNDFGAGEKSFIVEKANCSLIIDDTANVANYYAIHPFVIGSTGGERLYIDNSPLNAELINNIIFLTDETFDGKAKSIVFDWSYFSVVEDSSRVSFELEVYSLTKDYYDYLVSYNYFLENQGNPFADPVQVYSNIKGGFGVFAGYSLAAKVIRLK